MKSKITLSIFLLFLFIFFAGAAADEVRAQPGKLEGVWALSSLKADGKNVSLVVQSPVRKQVSVQMFLTKDSFRFQGTCNHMSGKYTATAGKLKVQSPRSTLKGCPDEEHEIDTSLVAALMKATKYQIKDKTLTFKDDGGKNVLLFNYTSSLSQYDTSPDNWKRVTKCGLSIFLPGNLRKTDVSNRRPPCTEEFRSADLRLTLSNTGFRDDFKKTDRMLEYKEEAFQIDGRRAQLITYVDAGGGEGSQKGESRKHIARLYSETTSPELMTNYLIITLVGKSEKDMETAREIFETVEFDYE